MAYEEKTLSSQIVYEGPVFSVRKHIVSTVSGGQSVRDIIEHSGGAIMVAVSADGKILMEKQYRKAFECDMLELPAGKADPGEVPEVTAARELSEETGYTAHDVRHLISFYPTCGYSNEYLHIYICKDLTEGERHLDKDECIDLNWYDAEELIDLIRKGEIKDGKTIIGILFARQAGEI
ncbi:MAG: NUDIX hydrolase [Mogibacterium sp.]|nr:NUDIX hydrolase [Mogibacterium sp.]